MTQQYDNTNRGALFKNDKREHDKQPTMKGSINVAGVEYWLSAWTNVSQKGDKYISLSVTPKEEIPVATDAQAQYRPAPKQAPAAQPAPATAQDDDEIPF